MAEENRTIEQRVGKLETQFESFMREMSEFKQEMRDFKTEMRDRDNQRAEEIRELRQKQDTAQAKHEAEMREITAIFNDKYDSLSKQINDTWRQTMLGVGGIIVAVGALLLSTLK